jgi:hypothetical protein
MFVIALDLRQSTTILLYHNNRQDIKMLCSVWKEERLDGAISKCQLARRFVVQQDDGSVSSRGAVAVWQVVPWHALLFCEIPGVTVYVAVVRNHRINYSKIGGTFQHVLFHFLIFVCVLVTHEWWMFRFTECFHMIFIHSFSQNRALETMRCLLRL